MSFTACAPSTPGSAGARDAAAGQSVAGPAPASGGAAVHALIARECRTPIQCGENWWGVEDMRHAVDARASDYMMPDVMKIGGVTGWMDAAALAQAHGIRISNHLWPEISAQLLSVTPTAHWLEYADWWNPVLSEPLQIENGMATVGDSAGTGIAWNEDAVSRLAA